MNLNTKADIGCGLFDPMCVLQKLFLLRQEIRMAKKSFVEVSFKKTQFCSSKQLHVSVSLRKSVIV